MNIFEYDIMKKNDKLKNYVVETITYLIILNWNISYDTLNRNIILKLKIKN